MNRAIPYVILLTCGCSLDSVAGTAEAPRDAGFSTARDGGGDAPHGDGDGDDALDAAVPDMDSSIPGDPMPPAPSDDAGGSGDGDADGPADAAPEPGPDSGSVPSFTPPAGAVGAPCQQNDQCQGFSAACLTTVDGSNGPVTIPNGYCTHTCNVLPCGANEKCVSASNGSGKICVRSCEENSDCRAAEGYECADKECTLPGL